MHVQSILEMVGCYIHFVEGSSVHTKPLTDLLKDEKKFLLMFPNQDSVVLHCKKLMMVQLPSRSRDHMDLAIKLLFWSLTLKSIS